jgi:hypothetical protein
MAIMPDETKPDEVDMSAQHLFFVIPGEDPGSMVQRSPLQTPAGRDGSRIKSGMTNEPIPA